MTRGVYRVAGGWAAVWMLLTALGCMGSAVATAQQEKPGETKSSQKQGETKGPAKKPIDIKKQVQLSRAQGNEKLQLDVEPGDQRLRLTLISTVSDLANGILSTTDFEGEGKSPHRALTTLSEYAKTEPSSATHLPVQLQAGEVDVALALNGLRASTTYKGQLTLRSGTSAHTWEVTLKAADRGALIVDKLPMVKLVTLHLCSLISCRPLAWLTGDGTGADRFPVTLHPSSDRGPFANVRVRLEDVKPPVSNALSSNFSIDSLTFLIAAGEATQPVDLAGHAGAPPAVKDNLAAKNSPAPTDKPPALSLTVPAGSSRTLWVRPVSLGPGEYTGVLRFGADGASEQAEESKLALTLQVRHHWWVAVAVATAGAVLGWFTNKFVRGIRTGRRLRAEGRALAQRVAFMARAEIPREGWQFPAEAGSYALARVRVIVSQVDRLARTTFVVIAAEQQITDRLAEARLRLESLELFRQVRLDAQPLADDRPAAQHEIGGTLRRALGILDDPAFDDTKRKAVAAILDDLRKNWLDKARRDAYRDAVLERAKNARSRAAALGFSLDGNTPPADTLEGKIRLLTDLLSPLDNAADPPPEELLRKRDTSAAHLLLLLRDRGTPWGQELVDKSGESLPNLYRIADTGLWEVMRHSAKQKKIEFVLPLSQPVPTQEPVEIRLFIDPPEPEPTDERKLDIPSARFVRHAGVVRWDIIPLDGGTPRRMETDGLTLVQYFRDPGAVNVLAHFIWKGQSIAVAGYGEIKVAKSPDYLLWKGLGSWVDLMVTGFAALFAIVTGLTAVYDATFGSVTQYITLFMWAAGVSTAGNLAKQLGPSPTPTATAAAGGAQPAASQ